MRELANFQLSLSQAANDISKELQKDVLASILYEHGGSDKDSPYTMFNREKEQRNLIWAYQQLGVLDNDVRSKINEHFNAADEAQGYLKEYMASDTKKINERFNHRPLDAVRQTKKIIDLSLESKRKSEELYSQLTLFQELLNSFMKDKLFQFDAGDLVIETPNGLVRYDDLSSGEKQLLILFIETLLQDEKPHVFVADEPELSLHIDWQRKIVPALLELNPNAQVIVATHSPEVAATFRDQVFDMEDLSDA